MPGEIVTINIPCEQKLSTRDGTLAQDGKMVNCFIEPTPEGKAAIKRPGTYIVAIHSGTPQGQLLISGQPYSIVNDVMYDTYKGLSYPIPGVTTALQTYNTLSDVPYGQSIIKSPSGIWNIVTTTGVPVITKITDSNYPVLTVNGLSYLDGTYYVMRDDGAVYGSVLQDVTTWPALNFIAADATLGQGAAITRHLNYIVAFYTHGTQFYFDAGLVPDLPLAPVSSAAWTTGCGAGASVKEASDITFFLSKTRQYGRTVSKFEGLGLNKISDPFIEKILNRSTLVGMSSINIKTAGHTFYGFTLPDLQITLIYDAVFEIWHVWTSVVNGVEQAFVGINYVASDTQDLFQDSSTGNTIAMDVGTYKDTTGQINVLVRTANFTANTQKRKRYAAFFLGADTEDTIVNVRYTDDDYNTFSTYRSVSLNTTRKMLQRCGMSRMRAWDLFHTENTPLRLFDIELHLRMAES